jgi:hypothetical protein
LASTSGGKSRSFERNFSRPERFGVPIPEAIRKEAVEYWAEYRVKAAVDRLHFAYQSGEIDLDVPLQAAGAELDLSGETVVRARDRLERLAKGRFKGPDPPTAREVSEALLLPLPDVEFFRARRVPRHS